MILHPIIDLSQGLYRSMFNLIKGLKSEKARGEKHKVARIDNKNLENFIANVREDALWCEVTWDKGRCDQEIIRKCL